MQNELLHIGKQSSSVVFELILSSFLPGEIPRQHFNIARHTINSFCESDEEKEREQIKF